MLNNTKHSLADHSDSRAFIFLHKIAYPFMGKIIFCSVLGLTEYPKTGPVDKPYKDSPLRDD